MKMNYFKTFILLAIVSVANMAMGGSYTYTELLSWDIIHADLLTSQGKNHYSHVVDGTTSYHCFNTGGAAITKVENINDVPTSSVLVSTDAWETASGTTSLKNQYGFGVVGNDLIWADTYTDAVWKANTVTGILTKYVSKEQIMAVTGETSVRVSDHQTTTPDGQYVFFDDASGSILRTTGSETVEILASTTELQNAFGDSGMIGGMTCLDDGALFYGGGLSRNIYSISQDGNTFATVLTEEAIRSCLGYSSEVNISFADIYVAPDGKVYFQEAMWDSILRFDPSDPGGTLEELISESELETGPMGESNVQTFGWYNGNLTFHARRDTGLMVLSEVPEPSTIMLLLMGMGVLALWLRK